MKFSQMNIIGQCNTNFILHISLYRFKAHHRIDSFRSSAHLKFLHYSNDDALSIWIQMVGMSRISICTVQRKLPTNANNHTYNSLIELSNMVG